MKVVRALCLTLLAASLAEAHKPTVTTFTFHEDIYPIFSEKCGACHRAGGVAPMSLLSYKEAFPWAVSIKNEVLNLSMPPWFADERYGDFKHAGALTPTEMDTIVDWCLGGSPEGDSGKGESPSDDSAWELGEPDLLLSMGEPITLGADENDRKVRVVLGSVASEVYLRGIDLKPGAANVVRSALVYAGDWLVGSWTPGSRAEAFPEATGVHLDAGSEIALELQYRKTWLDEGGAVEDASTLALYFVSQVEHDVTPLAIAAEPLVLEEGVELVSLLPTVTAAGEEFVAELVRPDGSREPLLRLHGPNPDFHRTYWLETPLALPKGATVETSHPLVMSVLRP